MKGVDRLVVALGGNALEGADGCVQDQAIAVRRALEQLMPVIIRTPHVLISHGNGPQVGNLLLRSEATSKAGVLPPLPLDTCVADTIGGLGYLVSRELRSALAQHSSERDVVALITTTRVSVREGSPRKPIGQVYPDDKAAELAPLGWTTMRLPRGGVRRTVPSPPPEAVLESESLRMLYDAGVIVIAGGGGGVPVSRTKATPGWVGVEAVVDKDLVSGLLAAGLGADLLLILTDVDSVCLDFGSESQRPIHRMDVEEARRHLEDQAFGEGSMAPKVEAACRFVESGGKRAVICHLDAALSGLRGEAGTQVLASSAVAGAGVTR